MDLIISALAQGMLWSLLSLGLFISFRILNIADMTTEGSFPLGACVSAILIYNNVNPLLSLFIAFIIGMSAGAVTGFLITVCKIPTLLSGILTMTAIISINLRIMGRPNLNILNKKTIFNLLELNLRPYVDIIIISLIIISIIISLIFLFFNSELGQAIIATGDNEKMAKSLGINTDFMIILGLMLSNGIIAMTGAIISQKNGFADVNSGLGVIVIALAAIIISEVIYEDVSFLSRLICIVIGAVIYRIILVVVLQLNIINTNDFKLVSAIMIAIFLTLPKIKSILGGNK